MKYYFAEACKNTFILFDCLKASSLDEAFLQKIHRCLKEQKRDDALILTEGKIQGDILEARMLVFGLDATFGEFCGNGARACAAYLFENFSFLQNFFLLTPAGRHSLKRHQNGIYSISLPFPRFELNEKFISDPELFKKDYNLCYVEMIEPHLTLEDNLSDEQLFSLGRELNQRKDLFPLGINVNVWHEISPGTLFVKTYERGVQRLTYSCGSGSIACAASYKRQERILAITPGGPLEIAFEKNGTELKGPAFFSDSDKREKED